MLTKFSPVRYTINFVGHTTLPATLDISDCDPSFLCTLAQLWRAQPVSGEGTMSMPQLPLDGVILGLRRKALEREQQLDNVSVHPFCCLTVGTSVSAVR